MDVPGTALRDQQIVFDITPGEAREANRAQRGRLLETVRALTPDQWTSGSRCADWTVQDVVRHVTHMAEVMHAGISAAQRGERYTPFQNFDPKSTPTALIRDEGDEPTAESLARFARSTADLESALDALPDDDSLLIPTPAGRQPWRRAILHALFDSSVHERDITAAVGLPSEPSADELTAIAAYQVLLAARVACMMGASFGARLELTGCAALTVSVDGASVSVTRAEGSDPVVATGDAVRVLDAMTGRGALEDALDAPTDVVNGLSTLRALV